MMEHSSSWQKYFMTMAYLVATKSKDPSTKVGAVIVGPDLEIRSTGYNGLPRGMKDIDSRYQRPLKYEIENHAEENAILNCCLMGVSTKNCTLYVPWIACSLCAKLIVQSGIIRVVYHKEWPGNIPSDNKWTKSIALTKEMFLETAIELVEYSGGLIGIKGYYNEQIFEVET